MAFNWLKNAVTGPFRAIGQLVQGKPRGFLGALGDTVKPVGIAASAIPGPWQAAGIPLAAAGGAMQKFDDEGQRNIGNILMGSAQGAGMAAGAGAVSGLARAGYGAISGMGAGGTTAAPTLATTSPTALAQRAGLSMPGAATTATATPASMASLIESNMPSMAVNAGKGSSMLSGIGKFLTGHPEIVTSALSTGADVYGAGMQGAALDRQLEFQREIERERQRQNEIGMLLQAIASMTPRGSY